MAGWTKKKPSLAVPCAMAIVLASTMMLGRILVEIGVVYPPLLTWALPALGAVIVVACATVVWMRYKHKTESTPSESLELNNPFRLGPALKFAGLYAAVLLAAKALTHWFGNAGTFGIAILSGTTDVDAITLTMANMALSGPHAGGVTPQVATTAILLAAACNTFVKAGMAMVLAGRALIQTVLYALMPVAGALLLAAAVVFWGA